MATTAGTDWRWSMHAARATHTNKVWNLAAATHTQTKSGRRMAAAAAYGSLTRAPRWQANSDRCLAAAAPDEATHRSGKSTGVKTESRGDNSAVQADVRCGGLRRFLAECCRQRWHEVELSMLG